MIRPALSIVVPCYNEASNLPSLIAKFEELARPDPGSPGERARERDWELVLVDNGPSDEMVAVVAPYTSDPRFVLVRQDNARAAGGVNAAARRGSTG